MYEVDTHDVATLKRLLTLMSRHAAGYHPISYTVWYAYVRGENPELRSAVDRELQSIGRLTPSLTYSLYLRHLVEPAEKALMATRADMVNMMKRMEEQVQAVGSDTISFDERLAAFQQQIAGVGNSSELSQHVAAMASEAERVGGRVGSFTDSLEKSQVEVRRLTEELDRLRQDAQVDTLSGLLNRRGFELEFGKLLQSAAPTVTISLIMFDIDHFKRINDSYGHLLGDAVIASVGRLVRDCVGSAGISGRYGGEEFVVAMSGATVQQVQTMAETIRHRVEKGRIKRKQSDEPIGGVTISLGVAHSSSIESLDAIMERADRALYRAKQQGRNRTNLETVLASG